MVQRGLGWAKFQISTPKMREVFRDPTSMIVKDQAILLTTYAKGYYKGGGWWLVSGYACDHSDTDKVLDALHI